MSIQNVPQENTFWLLGGKPIKNIIELGKELRQMSPETFAHHVNAEKNDFAAWIEYSVKDSNLATLLKTTKDKARMAAIVERRIHELTKPPKTTEEPAVVRTRNITPLKLAEEKKIIKTDNVTKLSIKDPPKTVVKTPHKTELKLNHDKPHREIYVHEIKEQHNATALLMSHVLLGIVVGAAIIIVMFA